MVLVGEEGMRASGCSCLACREWAAEPEELGRWRLSGCSLSDSVLFVCAYVYVHTCMRVCTHLTLAEAKG